MTTYSAARVMVRDMRRSWLLMLIGLVSAIAALAVLAIGAPEPALRVGPAGDGAEVGTEGGVVRGAVTPDLRSFRAIPYAAPPVGELRWRAPQPPPPWSDVRDAAEAGSVCPQMGGDGPNQPPRLVGSEDCLFLNVETPRGINQPLPVMVFLHGGAFVGGSGAPYNPTRLVTQGQVVFVSVNYRLGALGFLDHPALNDPFAGNFGLADQQAALRWVQHNIAAFGGDPGNVTLWGESAGAFSTCAQLAAPGARGLFHKAIVQSGPCGNSLLTPLTAQQRGTQTATTLGCADPASAADCLRAAPLQDLVGLNEDQITAHRDITGLPWLPVAGTPALPLQPLAAMQHGAAANVPLIQGGTRDEMRAFIADAYDAKDHPISPAEYPEIVRNLYGADTDAVLTQYPVGSFPTPSLTLATALTDQGRMLGACAQLPAATAAALSAPVYAYEFAQPADAVINDFPLGAHHGADVPYFFDSNFPGPKPPPMTGAKRTFADALTGYWTTFAHTGSPGPNWPAYDGATALSLALDRTEPVDLAVEHRCEFWRSQD